MGVEGGGGEGGKAGFWGTYVAVDPVLKAFIPYTL